MPNASGVDDYLHQAADASNWPDGIIYDPDNSGKPLPSLGVHEHWNSAEKMQYSGNLGLAGGIELISIPESLVKSKN
jgi:phosphoribosylanthranilate isomerase